MRNLACFKLNVHLGFQGLEIEMLVLDLINWLELKDDAGNLTGTLRFQSYKSAAEIESQLEAILKQIEVPAWGETATAWNNAESVLVIAKYTRIELTESDRRPLFYVDLYGEGPVIHLVFLNNDNDSFKPVWAVKYLVDDDHVWNICRRLNQAIMNGNN